MLSDILKEVDIASEIQEDFSVIGNGVLQQYDLIALNCARWSKIDNPDFPGWREKGYLKLSEEAREEFLKFFAQGKGMLALHTATLCFDDWDEYGKIVGARFTGHSPYYQEYRMQICSKPHPITEGIKDFMIMDELYTNPKLTDSVDPLIASEWEEQKHPILWVRTYEKGRICYNAMGHGVEAFENPTFQELRKRGARWVANKL